MMQKILLREIIKCYNKKRCLVKGDSRRSMSRTYFVRNTNGEEISVNKVFFLHTLRYSSGKMIMYTLNSATSSDIHGC